MTCSRAENLDLFLGGRLSGVPLESEQAHLETCAICFAKLAVAAASLSETGQSDFLPEGIATWLAASGLSASAPSSDRQSKLLWSLPPTATGQIGPYRLEGVLGHGGMGVVYRARHAASGEVVALKTVSSPDLAAFESLRQEIRFLKDAQQPGVVRVLDYDLSGGDPWFAMELLEGHTLAERHQTLWTDSLPPASGARFTHERKVAAGQLPDVLAIYDALCEPLDFIHRLGIVHCDLKPANVFLRHQGGPVLMDFGLVVSARGAVGREAVHPAVRRRGTLPYIAPEVIAGQIPDARADLYSFGCMLYESLTGSPPFTATSRRELYEQHLHAAHVPPSSLVAGVPAELDALVAGLLAKAPQDRIGHAQHVAERLAAIGATDVSAPRSSPTYLFRSQVVGRSEQLGHLERAIQQTRSGSGSLVLLDGESGIGKTFLASELAQRASMHGLTVVTGECHPIAHAEDVTGAALQGLRNFLDVVRDVCRRGGRDVTDAILSDHLGVLKVYAPALGALPAAQDIPEPAPLPDTAGRERLLSALTAVMRSFAAQAPLLLVLDDLQWADDLTLGLLEILDAAFFASTPLLVIGTYRTDEASSRLKTLAGHPWVTRIRLGRIEPTDTAAMIGQMLGVREPSNELVEFITAQAEGVPFFVAEYLRTVLTDGVLTFHDWHWSFSKASPGLEQSLRAMPFPKRLEQIIRRRTRALGESAQRVVEVGAVLGREFDLAVVHQVLDCSAAQVGRALNEAIERGILELSRAGRHRFIHDKFREVLYADMHDAERRELHGRSAVCLEAGLARRNELAIRASELARHYRLGGDDTKAVEHFERAGEYALQVAADADAVTFFDQALQLQKRASVPLSPVRQARCFRGMADGCQGLGRIRESVEHLHSAAAILGHPVPGSTWGKAAKLMAQVLRQVWRRSRGGARREAMPSPEQVEAGRIFERLHRASYYSGENLNLLLGCVTSLNILEPAGPSPELATGYTNAAAVCGILPAPTLAERYFRMATEALRQSPDPAVETQLRMVQSVFYMGRGNRSAAIGAADQGMGIADLIGFHRRHGECLAVRNGVDIFAGRVADADAGIAELESSARRRNDRQLLSWALTQKLEAHLLRGQFAEGRELFQSMSALLNEAAQPERLWALGVGSLVLLRADDFRAACSTALAAARLAAGTPPVHIYCIDGYDRLSEALIAICHDDSVARHGDSTPLRAARATALRRARKAAQIFPIAVPMWSLHAGSLAALAGRPARAATHWQAAIEVARALELPYHEGRACHVMSLAIGNGERSRQLDSRVQVLADELLLPLQGMWAYGGRAMPSLKSPNTSRS